MKRNGTCTPKEGLTTVAYHPGNIAKPIVAKILKQARITLIEFQKLRK